MSSKNDEILQKSEKKKVVNEARHLETLGSINLWIEIIHYSIQVLRTALPHKVWVDTCICVWSIHIKIFWRNVLFFHPFDLWVFWCFSYLNIFIEFAEFSKAKIV